MIRMRNLTSVTTDERATIYPTLASPLGDGDHWRVAVAGMLWRPGRVTLGKKLMLGILRRAMRASRADFETALFQQRIAGFLATAGRRRKLWVQIGDERFALMRRSRRSGMFHEDVRFERAAFERMVARESEPASANLLKVPVTLFDQREEQLGRGEIHVLPAEGVSVISDIDDTLKVTNVHHRRAMLESTFLRQFEPVAGMHELFRDWMMRGAAFHYVSSSPWQLFAPLAEHFAEAELPPGTMHLRAFRLRDHMLRRLFFGRRPAKFTVIRNLVQRFPQRKFVLVGDSGEHDPEIYGAIARRFPSQIGSILIRRVPGQNQIAQRWQRAFRQLPTTMWRLFDEPTEIADAV
jgi:hypothetical protein